jgi:chemotaxis protein MotA
MDIPTLIGTLGAFGCILYAIVMHGWSAIHSFVSIEGILIIFGGLMFCGLIKFPFASYKKIPITFMTAFRKTDYLLPETIERLVSFAATARRDGLLSLESKIKEIKDPFLLRGLQLIIDGVAPETVRAALNTEIEQMGIRHAAGKGTFEYFGAAAPAFGMVATLIGLVKMLANLSDPSTLGPAMSIALVATFYGAFSANFLFIPVGEKLHENNLEEIMARNLAIEGLLAIQNGENPTIIRERLLSFLSPPERAKVARAHHRDK